MTVIEALAESWASIDGKEVDDDGGYIEDAKLMRERLSKRGYQIIATHVWNGLVDDESELRKIKLDKFIKDQKEIK